MCAKLVVFIPTYNERDNISWLIRSIFASCDTVISTEVLVVDDNSPDGTADIVKDIAESDTRVHILVRKDSKGRGSAGIAGFKYALQFSPDYILEMDGDGSHSPENIPMLLEGIKFADVVIGSRYVSGGMDTERSLLRRILSNISRWYIKLVLGLPVSDPTSGFRLFRREVLEKIIPLLRAKDQFIVTEVLYRCLENNFCIKEIPIKFYQRKYGKTKLTLRVLVKYLFNTWRLK